MSLHDLRREYEERRRALIEQLQGNPSLDAATQHQIYGAIKEIENFIATIDAHQQAQAARGISVDLSRERPRPFVERSQKVFHRVRHGTGRVFKEHIPRVTKAIVAAPRRYVDRRRDELRLRREIEAELRARQTARSLNQEFVVLEHPHQVLPAEERMPALPATPAVSQDATAAQVVRKGAPIGQHPKRRKPIEVPAKRKAHQSLHAQGKKGGQHKPHRKHDKDQFKPSKRKRR